jgi:hypothetical protein
MEHPEGRRAPARLQDGLGGNHLEALGIALPVGSLAGLAQIQESGCAGGVRRKKIGAVTDPRSIKLPKAEADTKERGNTVQRVAAV